MKNNWVEIDELTSYLVAPGGVIVSREVVIDTEAGNSLAASMVFVPCDPVDFANLHPRVESK